MIDFLLACKAVQGTAYAADGTPIKELPAATLPNFTGVGIDTRKPLTGGLFVALKGPNFDAHDFLGLALEQGAVAVMTERYVPVDCPQIVVNDCYQALTDLACWWRRQQAVTVLAITGSVGKTSVKTMLASIMSQEAETLSTIGNLNNEIGVPLTLLRLHANHRFAVVEMGMNHAGEISRLSQLGAPDVALINNAGEAHIENLGSLDAIAAAKGEIFEGLGNSGIGVLNADDVYLDYWQGLLADKAVLTFGMQADADVTASFEQKGDVQRLKLKLRGESFDVRLNGRGEHNVMNALAAACTALAAGANSQSIVDGLEAYEAVDGRLNGHVFGDVTVYDDTYNANPTSMKAALKVVSDFNGAIALLGDMGELGDRAAEMHFGVGQYAAEQNISALWACGDYAQHYVDGFKQGASQESSQALAFANQAQLLEHLDQTPGTLEHAKGILVKGSRSAQMENVSNALIQRFQAAVQSSASNKGGATC